MIPQGRLNALAVLFTSACRCRASLKYTCQRCSALTYLEAEWPDEYAPMASSVAKLHGNHNAS